MRDRENGTAGTNMKSAQRRDAYCLSEIKRKTHDC